jgi:hypothetical protein
MSVSLKENNWFFVTDQTPHPTNVCVSKPCQLLFTLWKYILKRRRTKCVILHQCTQWYEVRIYLNSCTWKNADVCFLNQYNEKFYFSRVSRVNECIRKLNVLLSGHFYMYLKKIKLRSLNLFGPEQKYYKTTPPWHSSQASFLNVFPHNFRFCQTGKYIPERLRGAVLRCRLPKCRKNWERR